MRFRHHGPVTEWPQPFHDVLNDGPFILNWKECAAMTVFWILEPLWGEFS